MRVRIAAFLSLLICTTTQSFLSAQPSDSISVRQVVPFAISAGGSYSYVFRPEYARNMNLHFPNAESFSLNLYFKPNRAALVDSLFGNPYFGIGFNKPYLHQSDFLGNPYSIYLSYGLTILEPRKALSLGFEIKLGGAFRWKSYDKDNNPANRLLGGRNNYHAAADLYLKYALGKRIQARFGVTFTHNSNGGYRLPNTGLNTLGGYGDLLYNFSENKGSFPNGTKQNYGMIPHFEYDLNVMYGSRQIRGQPENTKSTGIIDHSFKTTSVNAFLMFVGLPYVRAGVGLSLIYDESTGIVVEQLIDKESAQVSYVYEPSTMSKRFSPGFLGKLEIPMGYISGFADVGYIFSRTEGFYSIMCANLGAKAYVYKGFNASFGIQMVPSRKANCTFISLGYSFNHRSVIRR